MMRPLLLFFLVAALSACGDNSSAVECANGTKLEGNECVPDGTVICDQGTMFDVATGQCVLDPSACAAGTVLMDGMCVPEGTIVADHEEAAEPNDDVGAGMFDAPALDQAVTIHGCVTPRDGNADTDIWIVTAATPMLLEITADGVGGLAAAFIFQDLGIASLETYIRFGLNLTGDTSKRQVYLPVAGQYALIMDDSRVLFTGEAVGSATTCYYGTIKQVALPAGTPMTFPTTTGMDSGNVRVITHTPGQAGDLLDITQTTTSEILSPSFVLRKKGGFYASVAFDDNIGAAFSTIGGFAPTDTVDIIVDNAINYALTPQPYSFDLFDVAAQQLPMGGEQITLTKHNGENPNFPWVDLNYSWFDVAAGDVVRFDVTSSVSVQMFILRRDIFTPAGAFDSIAALPTSDTFNGQFVRFKTAGRYYLMTNQAGGVAGETYTLTATRAHAVPTALTYGTAATAQTLPASGARFHTLDLNNQNWIELGVTATDFGAGNVRTMLYDISGEGWLGGAGSAGANYPVVQTSTQLADGTAPAGRITAGDTRDFLVRVESTDAVGAAPTYDIIARDRAHVALGTITPATPIVRTNMDATAAGAVTRYLVLGTSGHNVAASVTPVDGAVDISLQRRNVDDSAFGTAINAGGAGAAENLTATFGAKPWIAYTVTNTSATTTNLTSNLTATLPLPFVDICATGTVFPAPLNGSGDDQFSAMQTLPGGFTFNFFGVAQTNYIVSANGFITFASTPPVCTTGGCRANGAIPSAVQPNGIIAPYWDDLGAVKICKKEEATKVTIQWTAGFSFDHPVEDDSAAQMQVVLNSNGQIDLIYGAGHTLNGVSATVGIENDDGTVGTQVSRDTADGVLPSSSLSLTTQ
jgi:hypothetical protein